MKLTLRSVVRLPCLLALGMGVPQSSAPAASTYTNPVFVSQDPWVTQYQGNYYYSDSDSTCTQIRIRKSSTLTGLATATPTVVWTAPAQNANDTVPNAAEVYAPQVQMVNGVWYIYYTADPGVGWGWDHRIFALQSTTSSPMGPYVTPNTGYANGWIAEPNDNSDQNQDDYGWAIDPDIFTGADGNVYMTYSGHAENPGAQAIYVVKMSDALHMAAGTATRVSYPSESWETRSNSPIQEGPVGYTRNGVNYITYSASPSWNTDYCVGLLTNTSTNILSAGAWTKTGPIFDSHGSSYGPGSVVFIQSPDGSEWWNMYHGIDTVNGGYGDRDIRIQKMRWNADGSPCLGYAVNQNLAQIVPSGDAGNSGWGPSQNDSAQAGAWSNFSATGATLASGGNRNMLFRGGANLFDYTVTAQAMPTGVSGDDGFPKYGIFPLYRDANNYVLACVDTNNGVFATDAVVGGVDQGWVNSALPGGFVANQYHTIGVVKSDQTFTFKLDGAQTQQRMFALTEGQIGLYSDGMSAIYKSVSVTDNSLTWADAFGDAAEGAPQNGRRTLGWTVSSAGVAGTSLTGIRQIFQGNPNLPSYTLSAQMQWIATGAGDAYPKYGLMSCYNDVSNFVEVYLDIKYHVLATHAIVGGQDQGWQNSGLPGSFDPTQFHTLSVNKAGNAFTFSLDGTQAQQRSFAIANGQYGLITEATQANYRNIQVGP